MSGGFILGEWITVRSRRWCTVLRFEPDSGLSLERFHQQSKRLDKSGTYLQADRPQIIIWGLGLV